MQDWKINVIILFMNIIQFNPIQFNSVTGILIFGGLTKYIKGFYIVDLPDDRSCAHIF